MFSKDLLGVEVAMFVRLSLGFDVLVTGLLWETSTWEKCFIEFKN